MGTSQQNGVKPPHEGENGDISAEWGHLSRMVLSLHMKGRMGTSQQNGVKPPHEGENGDISAEW